MNIRKYLVNTVSEFLLFQFEFYVCIFNGCSDKDESRQGGKFGNSYSLHYILHRRLPQHSYILALDSIGQQQHRPKVNFSKVCALILGQDCSLDNLKQVYDCFSEERKNFPPKNLCEIQAHHKNLRTEIFNTAIIIGVDFFSTYFTFVRGVK